MSVFPGWNNHLGEASEQAIIWFHFDVYGRAQKNIIADNHTIPIEIPQLTAHPAMKIKTDM